MAATKMKNSRHGKGGGFGSVDQNNSGMRDHVLKGKGNNKPTGTPKAPKNRSAMVGNKIGNSRHGVC